MIILIFFLVLLTGKVDGLGIKVVDSSSFAYLGGPIFKSYLPSDLLDLL